MKKRYILLFLFFALLIASFLLPSVFASYGVTEDVRETIIGLMVIAQIAVFSYLGYLQWRAERAEMQLD